MKGIKLAVAIVAALAILSGCHSASKPRTDTHGADSSGVPQIAFKSDFFDFGQIKPGEKVSHTFRFTNRGNAPLIVKSVIPSCGCTDYSLSKKTVNPGDSASLEVVFDSRGWHGTQYKSVILSTNAVVRQVSVTIKATVVD